MRGNQCIWISNVKMTKKRSIAFWKLSRCVSKNNTVILGHKSRENLRILNRPERDRIWMYKNRIPFDRSWFFIVHIFNQCASIDCALVSTLRSDFMQIFEIVQNSPTLYEYNIYKLDIICHARTVFSSDYFTFTSLFCFVQQQQKKVHQKQNQIKKSDKKFQNLCVFFVCFSFISFYLLFFICIIFIHNFLCVFFSRSVTANLNQVYFFRFFTSFLLLFYL